MGRQQVSSTRTVSTVANITTRCGCSPDEELRIVSESRAASIKGFSLDWKSSCSISLMCSWLRESYVSGVGQCGMGNGLLHSKGVESFLHDIVLF